MLAARPCAYRCTALPIALHATNYGYTVLHLCMHKCNKKGAHAFIRARPPRTHCTGVLHEVARTLHQAALSQSRGRPILPSVCSALPSSCTISLGVICSSSRASAKRNTAVAGMRFCRALAASVMRHRNASCSGLG